LSRAFHRVRHGCANANSFHGNVNASAVCEQENFANETFFFGGQNSSCSQVRREFQPPRVYVGHIHARRACRASRPIIPAPTTNAVSPEWISESETACIATETASSMAAS